MYGLSFSESFFSGDEPLDSIVTSDRPTNVFQAILSLPLEDRIGIARDIFKSSDPSWYAEEESFAYDVVDMVRKTDLCDNYDSPITVYIDPEQVYSVTIHDVE